GKTFEHPGQERRQSAAQAVARHYGECRVSRTEETVGRGDRRLHAAAGDDHLARALAIVVVEGRTQQGSQFLAHGLVAQRHQRRQVVNALGQVLPGRLAQLVVDGDDVQDVVAQLVNHAEAASELGQRVAYLGAVPGGQRTDTTTRR